MHAAVPTDRRVFPWRRRTCVLLSVTRVLPACLPAQHRGCGLRAQCDRACARGVARVVRGDDARATGLRLLL